MNTIRKFFRDPLLWYLAAGGLAFLVTAADGPGDGDQVVITEGTQRSLSEQWQMQMGRPPSADELASLIESRVREEVLYREALKQGLDRDDTIIRRRLVQKMTFLFQDQADGQAIDDATLAGYFEENREQYREPVRLSYVHVYFSAERRRPGLPNAEERAIAALGQLREGAAPGALGDPFMLNFTYAAQSQAETERLFGTRFAAAIQALPSDGWQGPVESSYGYHLVRIQNRTESRIPSLEEIDGRVLEDLRAERRQRANEDNYRQIRARYQVHIAGEGAP